MARSEVDWKNNLSFDGEAGERFRKAGLEAKWDGSNWSIVVKPEAPKRASLEEIEGALRCAHGRCVEQAADLLSALRTTVIPGIRKEVEIARANGKTLALREFQRWLDALGEGGAP